MKNHMIKDVKGKETSDLKETNHSSKEEDYVPSGIDFSNRIFVNRPFFDWKEGEEEFGAFGAIYKDGFKSFINEKFRIEFVEMRKCYIKRDFGDIRFWAHKFKGSFKLFYSTFIYEPCEQIIDAIDTGMTIEIENLYCEFVVRMEIFFAKFANFVKLLNLPIPSDLLVAMKENFDVCDTFEDSIAFGKISENRRLYIEEGRTDFTTTYTQMMPCEIAQDSASTRKTSCICTGCSIF